MSPVQKGFEQGHLSALRIHANGFTQHQPLTATSDNKNAKKYSSLCEKRRFYKNSCKKRKFMNVVSVTRQTSVPCLRAPVRTAPAAL